MIANENRFAVFIDIDGTLLSDSFDVPQPNLDAIAAARALGHLVFINTGRSSGNIPPKLWEQLEVDGIVAGSGAFVSIGGKTEFSAAMSEELTERLAKYFFANRECWSVFEGRKNVYIIENELRKPDNYQIVVRNEQEFKRLREGDEIQVLAIGTIEHGGFAELFKDDITIFPFKTYSDCVVKGLNKAKGIERVLKFTGIKRENTIAIGDGANDYDMIKYAGIGVAMKNAQQRILDVADYVTDSNFDCGVAKAIERFLLKKQ